MADKKKKNQTQDTDLSAERQAKLASLQEKIREHEELKSEGDRLCREGDTKLRAAKRVSLDVGDLKDECRGLGIELPRSHDDILKLSVV